MPDSDNSCEMLSNLRGSHISVCVCMCVCVCVCTRACVCAGLVESQCSGQFSRWRDTWVETRIKLCWLGLQVGRIWANFRPQMWLGLMTRLTWLPFHTTSGFQASLEITVEARLGSQCPRTAPQGRECQPPASEHQCVLWGASPSHALDLFSCCRCLSSSAFVVRSANKQTKTKMSPDPKGLTVERWRPIFEDTVLALRQSAREAKGRCQPPLGGGVREFLPWAKNWEKSSLLGSMVFMGVGKLLEEKKA